MLPRPAVAILARSDIPHFVVGGIAVQEHGYYRVTTEADIVVPKVIEAIECLAADISQVFERVAERDSRVRDRTGGVFVDVLPAGEVLQRGCHVPFPAPDQVSNEPRCITLEQLISLKLDCWAGAPTRRCRDKADVVNLIVARNLPRDIKLHLAVQHLYEETWDALQREGPGPQA